MRMGPDGGPPICGNPTLPDMRNPYWDASEEENPIIHEATVQS